MGNFMNIPFHYVASNDPAKKRRDRREFSTLADAEDYEAQIAIENARKNTKTPSLDSGSLGTIYDKPRTGGSVKELTMPGSTLGSTPSGQAAFKYEEGKEQKTKESQALDVYTTRANIDEDERETLIALMEGGRHDEAFSLLKMKQATGSLYGKSGKGAAYEFTENHPELVEKLNAQLDILEGAGIDKTLIDGWRNHGAGNVEEAQEKVNNYLAGIKGAVQKLEETLPGKVKTAAATTAASTGAGITTKSNLANVSAETEGIITGGKIAGKERAEQNILTGTTIPGLKAVSGVRQTEQSINKVKDAKPKIEILKKSMDGLLSEYEKNGWKPIGPESANYESLVRITQLLSKEADGGLFNLGVLNGPDLSLLNEIIVNPGSFKSGLKMARYGESHIGKRLNNIKELIDLKTNEFYKSNGFEKEISGGKPKVPTSVLKEALDAIDDPDAPEEVKNKARRILTNAGM